MQRSKRLVLMGMLTAGLATNAYALVPDLSLIHI